MHCIISPGGVQKWRSQEKSSVRSGWIWYGTTCLYNHSQLLAWREKLLLLSIVTEHLRMTAGWCPRLGLVIYKTLRRTLDPFLTVCFGKSSSVSVLCWRNGCVLLTLRLEVDWLLEQAHVPSCSTKNVNVVLSVKVVLTVSRKGNSLFLSDRLFLLPELLVVLLKPT